MTAIIFDIGGVLVHDIWEPLCFGPGGIAETYGLPMEQFRDFATKINIEYAKTPLAVGDTWQRAEHACWSRVIDEFSSYFPDSIIPEDLALLTDDFIHPLNQEEIVQVVRMLKERGVGLGICSDMSSFLYARIKEKLNLEELFTPEHIIVSYAIGVLKMEGFQMFEAVTQALGEAAKECTFFDDRLVNITKAQEYGIEAVLVPASSGATSVVIKEALAQKGLI